jgi:hypothetical protein
MDAANIVGLVFIVLFLIIFIFAVLYFAVNETMENLGAILLMVVLLFIYVLIFNLIEPKLDEKIFIDPDMKLLDYIWYFIILVLILFLSAALIHSIYISSELIAYFLTISVGITMFLIVYTIIYRVYKNREKLGKIVFILTIYVILLTFVVALFNKLLPAPLLKIVYILYSCLVFGYVCCFVVLICRFIYNLIVNPQKFQNYTYKFNFFQKLNAGAFRILKI